ncbi:MAG: CRISPR-associated endonuclease Cas3'', partial [Oscillospiraceae bacterium]|nr:CRISPR-associated endonuclease Cas3'' [Oscillospiraceae bacterium]
MERPYLAHSPTEHTPEGQPLKQHLENVAALCEAFCRPFGAGAQGRACGLYHDIGKYSQAFQARLFGDTRKVDHSTAGAYELFRQRAVLAAMCVAGHHGGLTDKGTRFDLSGTFSSRILHAKEGGLEDYSAWTREIPMVFTPERKDLSPLEAFFYVKMLFSALTDADWLDTDAYYRNEPYLLPETDLSGLWARLERHIAKWWGATEGLNVLRCEILRAAIDAGREDAGLFTMTVPTGGGKTNSSMAFALRHALAHGMRRIIYVIPYCSILDQTHCVFAEIFGRENITAHYGGAEFAHPENGSDPRKEDTRAFSAENWEAPIILTTAVQFFESLYSNKPGKCRKLHNIAGSVIVFDEAQMLPVPFLEPCLAAICQLIENYRCSAVLCTATQPAVGQTLQELAPELRVRELCPEPERMYQAFRRVTYRDEGELDDEALAERLRACRQVLCVVNSR